MRERLEQRIVRSPEMGSGAEVAPEAIPEFPNFKKLELSDKTAIERFTNNYPPYSDFNFTSLWAWDTNEQRHLSVLNGNLIVRFTDYRTHEPFLSFLGSNEAERTAKTLIEYARENALPPSLGLMPEDSVRNIRSSILRAEEDRDNFDYVYSVPELSRLSGNRFHRKKTSVNNFRKKNPNARAEIVDLGDTNTQGQILAVLQQWKMNKLNAGKEHESDHEEIALRRLMQSADAHDLIVTGIFSEETMAAFSIEEMLPNQYCMGHFWKADNTFKGAYDFLIQEKARHLETLNVLWINYEQDFGIQNLRDSKLSLRPDHFIKKYNVTMD